MFNDPPIIYTAIHGWLVERIGKSRLIFDYCITHSSTIIHKNSTDNIYVRYHKNYVVLEASHSFHMLGDYSDPEFFDSLSGKIDELLCAL